MEMLKKNCQNSELLTEDKAETLQITCDDFPSKSCLETSTLTKDKNIEEGESSNVNSSNPQEDSTVCKSYEHEIPTQLIEDKPSLRKAVSNIKGNKLIAVDCEGVKLSRKGTLTILTLATENMVYIFDIFKLGQEAFDDGLRDILEDKSMEKLMFDCRQDSDSLWHQYRVKLDGVLDLQLLEVMYRRDNGSTMPTKKTKGGYRFNRRSEKDDDVESIYGYGRCIKDYVGDENLIRAKNEGKVLLENHKTIWTSRPLTQVLIDYCSVDTYGMFPLYKKLKESDAVLPRLRKASERYVDMLRGKEERIYDEYETHAFLPLDIIPEKWTLDFPNATTKCTKCNRVFPREEFSFFQLKHGDQKCRVCKKVKRLIDVEENRQDNFARAWEAEQNSLDAVAWMEENW